MARIAQSMLLRNMDRAVSPSESGFLIWAGTQEKYAQYTMTSRYCYVAVEEGKILGFLTTSEPEHIASLPLTEQGEALRDESGAFPLLIGQVGVLQRHRHEEVSQILLDRLLQDAPHRRIVSMVVLAPMRDEWTLRFLEKNQWKHVKQVQGKTLLWGMWELRR